MANTKAPSVKEKKAEEKIEVAEKPIVAKDIDPDQYVTVINGFQGRLVYVSSKTNERFVWDGFGAEQEMQLRELRNAKNTYKKFFINNWFMFNEDEDWVIDYLGMRQYYKNAIGVGSFDDVFSKSPTEMKKIIDGLSEGQKKSVAYRAFELIAQDKIDSRKTISLLEESLGIDLIEK